MNDHKPTKALAAFAAELDPSELPADVRQKLGWLLLDYLRVCSIGTRLPAHPPKPHQAPRGLEESRVRLFFSTFALLCSRAQN